MFGDLAKANKKIELSGRMIEALESALAESEKMTALLQQAHEADKLKLKQYGERIIEIAAKEELAIKSLTAVADVAIAKVRALEKFLEDKGLWDEFRATTKPT